MEWCSSKSEEPDIIDIGGAGSVGEEDKVISFDGILQLYVSRSRENVRATKCAAKGRIGVDH